MKIIIALLLLTSGNFAFSYCQEQNNGELHCSGNGHNKYITVSGEIYGQALMVHPNRHSKPSGEIYNYNIGGYTNRYIEDSGLK